MVGNSWHDELYKITLIIWGEFIGDNVVYFFSPTEDVDKLFLYVRIILLILT